MNYIVFDLEWNQGMDSPKGKKVPRFEVIEIGAIKLDEKCRVMDSFHCFINPKIYYRMNYVTREMTGLTMGKLKHEGEPFTRAMGAFHTWCGKNYRFCTWGDGDLSVLQENCDYYNLKGLFKKPLYFYDLQKLFSLQYEDGKSRRNLKSAVDFFELPEHEAFHGAYSDARYTAEILKKLDMKTYGKYISVDYHVLPATKEEEIYLDFGTYTKYISKEYPTKELAMVDRTVTSTTCHECGRKLRKKIRWFSSNGKQFYSLSYCKDHGWMKGKIRMKKAPGGGVFVVKTQKAADEAAIENIRGKQTEMRNKRKRMRSSKDNKKE